MGTHMSSSKISTKNMIIFSVILLLKLAAATTNCDQLCAATTCGCDDSTEYGNVANEKVRMIPRSTYEDCSFRCSRSVKCVAFSYNQKSEKCFLRHSIEQKLLPSKTESFFIGCGHQERCTTPIIKDTCNCKKRKNSGGKIRLVPNLNRHACATLCSSHPKCRSFAYNLKENKCFRRESSQKLGKIWLLLRKTTR